MGDENTTTATQDAPRVAFVLDSGRLAAVRDTVTRLAGGTTAAADKVGAACRMGMHPSCSSGSCACDCHSTGMAGDAVDLRANLDLAGLSVQDAARAGLLRSSECLAGNSAECASPWCGDPVHDARFSADGRFDCGDLDPDELTACLQCGCIGDSDDTFCSRCGSKLPSVPGDGMSPTPSRVASAAPAATLARLSDACKGDDHGRCGFPACTCDCHAEHAASTDTLAHEHADGECEDGCEDCEPCRELAAAARAAAALTAPGCSCARFSSLDAEGLCGECGGRPGPETLAALRQLGLIEQAISEVVEAAAVASPAPPIDPNNPGRFSAVLLTEEEQTGDGRIIAKGATTWRPLPLTLMYQPENLDGHTGAVPVGTIEKITRKGLQVVGEGTWDTSPQALECARLVRDGVVTGISIDGGDVEAEIEMQDDGGEDSMPDLLLRYTAITIMAATVLPIQAVTSAKISYLTAGGAPSPTISTPVRDELGAIIAAVTLVTEPADFGALSYNGGPIADRDTAWDAGAATARVKEWASSGGSIDFAKYARAFFWVDSADKEKQGSYKLGYCDIVNGTLTVIPKAVFACAGAVNGARGGVDIPDSDVGGVKSAIGSAYKALSKKFDDPSIKVPWAADLDSLAAAGPRAYPAEYFAAPAFTGPTPVRVLPADADGVCRVEGHLATWDQCHVSFTNECVLAPHSHADYRYFMTGQLPLAEGGWQSVGTVTLNARHADQKLSQLDAAAHYDHTGLAAAYVATGEDKYGIWVSGVLAPGLSQDDATKFAGASLSGDWRRVGGHLELVAALCVNTPGFPIARFAGGVQTALVAAGFGPEAREKKHLSAMFDSLDDRVQERLAAQDAVIADLRGQVARLAAQAQPLIREHLEARLAAAVAPAPTSVEETAPETSTPFA